MNKKFFIIVFAVLVSISFAFIVKETQSSSNKLAMAKGLFEKQLEISLNNAKDITKNDEFLALSIKGGPEINIENTDLQ